MRLPALAAVNRDTTNEREDDDGAGADDRERKSLILWSLDDDEGSQIGTRQFWLAFKLQ